MRYLYIYDSYICWMVSWLSGCERRNTTYQVASTGSAMLLYLLCGGITNTNSSLSYEYGMILLCDIIGSILYMCSHPPLEFTIRVLQLLDFVGCCQILSDFVPLKTRSTRDRSIPQSLQRWVSTKSSISQLSFFYFSNMDISIKVYDIAT